MARHLNRRGVKGFLGIVLVGTGNRKTEFNKKREFLKRVFFIILQFLSKKKR